MAATLTRGRPCWRALCVNLAELLCSVVRSNTSLGGAGKGCVDVVHVGQLTSSSQSKAYEEQKLRNSVSHCSVNLGLSFQLGEGAAYRFQTCQPHHGHVSQFLKMHLFM